MVMQFDTNYTLCHKEEEFKCVTKAEVKIR
jgi:hypothetical protein